LRASTLIRPWFGVSRGEGGRTRVTFVWEPAARVPGDRVRRSVSTLLFQARSADGAVLFEGPVAPTGPAAIDEPGAAPARAIFEMPAGRLRLRMSIRDSASTVLDEDVRELSIRDLKGDVAVGTLEILRARTAREFQTVAADPNAIPAPGREFSRTERLLIRFDAYGPGTEKPEVTAVLLNRGGSKMSDVQIAPGAAGATHQIDLGLASIPAGEYLIEITGKGASGEAKELVPFRVGS